MINKISLKNPFRWISHEHYDADAYPIYIDESFAKRYFIFVQIKSGCTPNNLDELFKSRFGFDCVISSVFKSQTSNSKHLNSNLSEDVITQEDGVFFKLQTSNVLNPGLFIDQSENRSKLKFLIKNKPFQLKLLNLFSYTGSFSIVAKSAGIEETISIDVSKRYLQWEKQNQILNVALNENYRSRLIQEDARDFIKKEIKRNRSYDFIIFDPPTFSKSLGKAFKARKEYFTILESCLSILNQDGWILAACNDARWSLSDFKSETFEFSKKNNLEYELGLTNASFPKNHSLKSCWLHKKTLV